MDVTMGPAPAPPEQPLAGGRIDWTIRDVALGLVAFLAVFLVVPIPFAAPFAIAFGAESDEYYAVVLLLSSASEVALVGVAAWFTFRKYGGGWERLGVWPIGWRAIGWGLAAFVGALILNAIYGSIVAVADIEALQSECTDQLPREVLDDGRLMVLAGIAVVAFAPVCEELFFRGFIFPGVLARWGVAAGVLGSAFLFSAAHIGPNLHKTIVPIFIIGAVFAFAYFRSRNIASTVLAHAMFNIMSFSLLATCDTTDAAIFGGLPRLPGMPS